MYLLHFKSFKIKKLDLLFKIQNSKFKFKIQNSKFKFKIQNSKFKIVIYFLQLSFARTIITIVPISPIAVEIVVTGGNKLPSHIKIKNVIMRGE